MTPTDAEKRISSVGIDVGTSTSHLIFSELVLRKDPNSRTEKYHVAERNIQYRGNIFFTPLTEKNEINLEELTQFLLKEYQKAGKNTSEIDTGAVIITGESAKKENAEKIIEILARETGKFVAASAGPNFEAIISAYGSGAVKYSKEQSCKVIHTDVGGGTSNIAVIQNGEIHATACINVGGRLIVFNDKEEIIRLEPAGKIALDHCKLDLGLGDTVTLSQKSHIAYELTSALFEVIRGQKLSLFAKKLMMTSVIPIESAKGISYWSFSGGVAEYIYKNNIQYFNDLGLQLGQEIRSRIEKECSNIWIEVPEKIRATVIGASEYTLQVSGSTTFMSPDTKESSFPIRNLPIVTPLIQREMLSEEYIASQISAALQRLDLLEGNEPIALAFHDPVRTVYEKLTTFSKGVVKALPKTISNNRPIILIFDTDIGNSVGNVLQRETGVKNDILSIDEIFLKEGDFIDIGQPIVNNRVFPVVVKSLIFE
ncbi:MAG: ethanolamine ammonia-lyase reactivating factor EutA [Candidatus Heimdallarchaeota archaeon]|nr:MAG: ethanolamine ammonia-lyase reactivating factor EutA [Candidatus Heimdallarchaeota archaeon]